MTKSIIRAELACPVERVWETLTDLAHPDWRRDIERVEVISKESFVEYSKGGFATFFTITRQEPPYYWADWDGRAHWAFDMESENMKGHWLGVIEPSEGGCTVTFTEKVAVKKAWMRPFVKIYLKKQQKQYISDLRQALGL